MLPTFDYFELVDPPPDQRWAGGYGHGDDGTLDLEVLHRVDGIEVSVRTQTHFEWFPPDHGLKMALQGLLFETTISDDRPLVLPQTWTLESDDRRIRVNTTIVEFRGIRLRDMWAGVARVGKVEITVSARGDVAIHALAICKDLAMPDRPPLD